MQELDDHFDKNRTIMHCMCQVSDMSYRALCVLEKMIIKRVIDEKQVCQEMLIRLLSILSPVIPTLFITYDLDKMVNYILFVVNEVVLYLCGTSAWESTIIIETMSGIT